METIFLKFVTGSGPAESRLSPRIAGPPQSDETHGSAECLTHDNHALIRSHSSDARAAKAVELFCYASGSVQTLAVLGGVETLVFAEGIGDNIGEVHVLPWLRFPGVDGEASNARRPW